MLRGRTIVVGVSGGIAAYKACELVRALRRKGASVIVVMTPAAVEFVTPLTFQALSGNPVVRDLWGDQAPRFDLPKVAAAKVGGRVEHVDVAEAADALVVAPATADLMARLVHGTAPDALTSVALACPAPLIVCPAMDLEMWRRPATRANVKALKQRGAILVGPETGELASGLSGPGRLAEVEAIVAAVERAVTRRSSLAGVKVLIGTGRTEEPLDPVRVLTNRSSGRMGFALAEAARDRGAQVTVVAGPTSVEAPHGVGVRAVTTAAEMERAMIEAARAADLIVMAAAVADYRPASPRRGKIKRGKGPLTLELIPNPDIIAALAERRRPGQVLVGFALETSQGLKRAREKRRAKGLDLVVLNSPRAGLGGETNRVTLVEEGSSRALPTLPKREVAEAVLDRAFELRTSALRRAGRAGRRTARRPGVHSRATGVSIRKPNGAAGRGRGARA